MGACCETGAPATSAEDDVSSTGDVNDKLSAQQAAPPLLRSLREKIDQKTYSSTQEFAADVTDILSWVLLHAPVTNADAREHAQVLLSRGYDMAEQLRQLEEAAVKKHKKRTAKRAKVAPEVPDDDPNAIAHNPESVNAMPEFAEFCSFWLCFGPTLNLPQFAFGVATSIFCKSQTTEASENLYWFSIFGIYSGSMYGDSLFKQWSC
eukprot:m.886302 g.886302  ORF g.886302 m.886302 type:complete len:207 (-) comp23624_c0_seq24:1378-1998(-)